MEPQQVPINDRLSNLSNDLICRIISNLDSRQAVQTSLLSRRWRNLWCSLTSIKVDFCEFDGETDSWEGDQARFRKFVNNLLLRRDPVPVLDKFCLRSYIPHGANDQEASADANLWISHALQLKAPVVEVDQDIQTRDTLELGGHAVFASQYLTRLVLSAVSFTQGFFKQLEIGCSKLEHLSIYDSIVCVDISSKTLKVLIIDNSEFSYDYNTSISTPSATSLTLIDLGGRLPLLKDMGSLVSASVYLTREAIPLDTAINIDQWFMGLSGVRHLALDFPVEVIKIKDNMQWCPKFNNLVNLTLGRWCLDSKLYALTVFLQNSPKLEKLRLEIDEGYTAKDIKGELKERSFTCEHLKIVEVDCVEDDPLEVECLEDEPDPLVNRVKKFFRNSGMTSIQINITHLDYHLPYEYNIEDNMQWCSKLNNLVNLTLGRWCLDSKLYALTVFLQNSPKLEKLRLEIDEGYTAEKITCELQERSFTCEHLKIVEVACVEDDPLEVTCLEDDDDDDPLVDRVEKFFRDSGMTSLEYPAAFYDSWRVLSEFQDLLSLLIAFDFGKRPPFYNAKWLSKGSLHHPRPPPVRRNASAPLGSPGWLMEPEKAPGRGRLMLSDLPDDLIRRIMSFLYARQAVRTCVLSRRWRDLWRSLTRINADFCEFKGDTRTWVGDKARFEKFLNALLLRRDPVLLVDKFWLRCPSCSFGVYSLDANLWISHVLQLQAPVLDVRAVGISRLNQAVFTSQYLRRLALSSVVLSKGFFNQLKMRCPELECLFLRDCHIHDHHISSQTLKILTINISDFSFVDKYDCCISTPSVTALTLFGPKGRVPLLQDMASLVSASVYLANDFSNFGTAVDVHRLLTSLSGVKYLALDFDGVNEVQITNENNIQWCPEFIDLVSLTLGSWCLESNFYGLTVFLQNSPKLEKLTLKLNKVHTRRIVGKLKEKSFTCERLKVVEVICIGDDPLVNCVEEFFFNSGMTSLQIRINHLDGYELYEPRLYRDEYRRRQYMG
uniref:F-box domain-containing protein n=1 Tax=Oryza rufipogon TaxID=4529 RepID=A0A0E0QVU7_ORYRU